MVDEQSASLITILVVDDHPLFRRGVIQMLEIQPDMTVVGEAGDGETALKLTRQLLPDLILMDVTMPHVNGLEATRRILHEMPATRIIMLTVNDDDDTLFEAIKAGARGYLLKNLEPEDLVARVHGAMRNEAALPRTLASRILREFSRIAQNREVTAVSTLSRREREVLVLVAQGQQNKEIAAELVISEHTVKNHLRNILGKLHVRNRVEAAMLAMQEGLID